jgi:hypothetical protein
LSRVLWFEESGLSPLPGLERTLGLILSPTAFAVGHNLAALPGLTGNKKRVPQRPSQPASSRRRGPTQELDSRPSGGSGQAFRGDDISGGRLTYDLRPTTYRPRLSLFSYR